MQKRGEATKSISPFYVR